MAHEQPKIFSPPPISIQEAIRLSVDDCDVNAFDRTAYAPTNEEAWLNDEDPSTVVANDEFSYICPFTAKGATLKQIIDIGYHFWSDTFSPDNAREFYSSKPDAFTTEQYIVEKMQNDAISVQLNGLHQTVSMAISNLIQSQTIASPESVDTFVEPSSPNYQVLIKVTCGLEGRRGDQLFNYCEGVEPSAEAMSPESVMKVHIADLVRQGKAILIPARLGAQALQNDKSLVTHGSTCFIATKPTNKPPNEVKDPQKGRFIANYSQPNLPYGEALNGPLDNKGRHEFATAAAKEITPIVTPTLLDICRCLVTMKETVGIENVFMEVTDINTAYWRVASTPGNALVSILILSLFGEVYWLIPLVAMFGHYMSGYYWQVIIDETVRQSNKRARETYGITCCDTTMAVVDDTIKIGPLRYLDNDREADDRLAGTSQPGLAGINAKNKEKNQLGRKVLFMGYSLDMTIGGGFVSLSPKRLVKIIACAYLLVPAAPKAGEPILASSLQRLFSLLYQLAICSRANYLMGHAAMLMYPLKGHSNLTKNSRVRMTQTAAVAIHSFRAFLVWSMYNPKVFLLPIGFPLITNRLHPSETPEEHGARQAALADIEVHCDASKIYRTIGIFIDERYYGGAYTQFTIPEEFLILDEKTQQLTPWTINMLELLALVMSTFFAQALIRSKYPLGGINLHIHKRGDSKVALGQVYSSKANRTYSRFLVHTDMQGKATSPHFYTEQHEAGKLNIVSDAISRLFSTDSDGSIQQHLSRIPFHPPPQGLLQSLRLPANFSTNQHLSLTLAAKTTATLLTGWSFITQED